MSRYVFKRLVMLIPVLIGVTFLVYFIISLSPGDTAAMLAGEDADAETIEALRKELGLSETKKTTDDLSFTVETVACLGACSSAPAIMLNDEIYPTMTPESAVALVKSLKENG